MIEAIFEHEKATIRGEIAQINARIDDLLKLALRASFYERIARSNDDDGEAQKWFDERNAIEKELIFLGNARQDKVALLEWLVSSGSQVLKDTAWADQYLEKWNTRLRPGDYS